VRSNAGIGACRHGAPALPKMVHLSFSTDPVEVEASRHPNARLFFHSRPETDRTAQ
jgi:hypothetical protein